MHAYGVCAPTAIVVMDTLLGGSSYTEVEPNYSNQHLRDHDELVTLCLCDVVSPNDKFT